MQDISRVVGSPVIIQSKVLGGDFQLRGMTFEDLGTIQNHIIRGKRKRVLETAVELSKMLPPDEASKCLEDARREATQIAYIEDDEFDKYIRTPEGGTMFLWVLFDRQHPGKATLDDIFRMLVTGEFGKDNIAQLVQEFVDGGPAGNSTGQSTAA